MVKNQPQDNHPKIYKKEMKRNKTFQSVPISYPSGYPNGFSPIPSRRGVKFKTKTKN
jgi:hypothetical protein